MPPDDLDHTFFKGLKHILRKLHLVKQIGIVMKITTGSRSPRTEFQKFIKWTADLLKLSIVVSAIVLIIAQFNMVQTRKMTAHIRSDDQVYLPTVTPALLVSWKFKEGNDVISLCREKSGSDCSPIQ